MYPTALRSLVHVHYGREDRTNFKTSSPGHLKVKTYELRLTMYVQPVTIGELHYFFVLLVFHPFRDCRSKRTRSHETGASQNGTASNRDNLSKRSLTMAQAVLDRLETCVVRLISFASLPAPKPNQDVQPDKQPRRDSKDGSYGKVLSSIRNEREQDQAKGHEETAYKLWRHVIHRATFASNEAPRINFERCAGSREAIRCPCRNGRCANALSYHALTAGQRWQR